MEQYNNRLNSYTLSRNWFNFSFNNPELVKPSHSAVYFFAIEHCNRLGWKEKFGFPTTMVMEAIGIKSYNTYVKTLNDLVDFGFIKIIEKSKNQYSSNIIALSNFDKAHNKALDKALAKHVTKQRESTVQSIDSIIKQINNKQYNNKELEKLLIFLKSKNLKVDNINNTKNNQISTNKSVNIINNNKFKTEVINDLQFMEVTAMQTKQKLPKIKHLLDSFEKHLIQIGSQKKDIGEFKRHFSNWLLKQDLKKSYTYKKQRYV